MNQTQPETPVKDTPPTVDAPKSTPLPQPPKSAPSFWKRALRVLLGILILLGLGSLLIIFSFYLPTRQALKDAKSSIAALTTQSATEMQAANQEITRLSSLKPENEELQTQLTQAKIKIAILQARLDIASAQLALANKAPDQARLALKETAGTLKTLASLLPPQLQEKISDLLARLQLALNEIEDNPYAAQSDLDVLNAGLIELESKIIQ
jgi:PIN domain nuclease of toxin-antitoxin system